MNYLLTLDLATHIGWTRGRPDDRYFDFGTHGLPKTGDDIGAFLSAYQDWLSDILPNVELCVFEAPILPPKTRIETLRKLYGLAGHTEVVCRYAGVKCMEVNLMQVRAFIGAHGKAGVIEAIRRYGFDPADDDQADAIAVRLYVLHRLYPNVHGMDMGLGVLGGAVR